MAAENKGEARMARGKPRNTGADGSRSATGNGNGLMLEDTANRIAKALEQIAENTKQESLSEQAAEEIMDLRQTIRNFGIELQTTLDNPPRNGMEMAQRMRELAARMSGYGIPQMYRK